MDKMTIEKAKDILREYPEHQAWEDEQFYQVLCLKGFIEGYESRDAEVVLLKSEVEELKKQIYELKNPKEGHSAYEFYPEEESK